MANSPSTRPIPILFVHYGDNWFRGSEQCLLSLISCLDKTQFQPIVWTNNAVFARELKAQQILVHQSHFTLLLGWESPKYHLGNFARLVWQGLSLVRRYNIKLLHANSAAPVQWLCSVARCCRLPLVAHLHSRYPLRDRLTLGLYNASMCVGVSQAVIAPLRADGLCSERTCVIYNGIDTQLVPIVPLPSAAVPISPRPFVLASIGSLIRRKGVDLILQACYLLRQKGHHIELHLFGDGPELASLLEQSQQLGLKQQVRFFGDVPNAAAYLFDGIDAYVSGARDEAFGLVLAEAGLAGLPVVAPDVGGISEVIQHNHSGLLVPANNSEALAQAIEQLIQNPSWAKQLGNNGRALVRQHFSREQMAQQFAQLYLQLLADPRQHLSWWDLIFLPKSWFKALSSRRSNPHPHKQLNQRGEQR